MFPAQVTDVLVVFCGHEVNTVLPIHFVLSGDKVVLAGQGPRHIESPGVNVCPLVLHVILGVGILVIVIPTQVAGFVDTLVLAGQIE